MWSKFDDQFYLNPKNANMDRDEQDLYIAGIIYCNGQLTDGFIPSSVLMMLFSWAKIPFEANAQANAQAIALRLIEHSYWEAVPKGYKIHDFLDWNLSKQEVLELKEKRSNAGKIGGKNKNKTKLPNKETDDQASDQTFAISLDITNDKSNGVAKSNPVPVPVPVPLIKEKELKDLPDTPIVSLHRSTSWTSYLGSLNSNSNSINNKDSEIENPISLDDNFPEQKKSVIGMDKKNKAPKEQKIKRNPSDPDYWKFLGKNQQAGIIFFKVSNVEPIGREYSKWVKGFNELEEAGITVDDIPMIVEKMRKEILTISAPQSLLAVGRDMKSRGLLHSAPMPHEKKSIKVTYSDGGTEEREV